MELNDDTCYRALRTRDSRFDGRFYTAVTTTGIYCRPVCPARTPKRSHVRFFKCAAAAQEAGFRPCLRCRPETAPGSAAWRGTTNTVERALRLIAGGALDDGNSEDLAQRLGVGARHLRRLFQKHLGTTPRAVAQTNRVLTAKNLLHDSSLPIATIALVAGFKSVRRFNETFLQAFGKPPGVLRRHPVRPSPGNGAASFVQAEMGIAYRPPLNWDLLLTFLSKRAIPQLEQVVGQRYYRGFASTATRGLVEVSQVPSRHRLRIRVLCSRPDKVMDVVNAVRDLFDTDCEPSGIESALSAENPVGAFLRKHEGIRVPGAYDGFEMGVRAVLGQQISVAGARTLAGRIVAAYGEELDIPDEQLASFAPSVDASQLPTRAFPAPVVLAEADGQRIGLTRQRLETLRSLSRAVATGKLDLSAAADPQRTREILLRLQGVGPWTTEYIAMRALRDPDAFPASDLGIRKALQNGSSMPSVKQVEARSQAWRPWRAYAAMALWHLHPVRRKGEPT